MQDLVLIYSYSHNQKTKQIHKELVMQNSHCNNGTLGLTYLTNHLGPLGVKYEYPSEYQNLQKAVNYIGSLSCSLNHVTSFTSVSGYLQKKLAVPPSATFLSVRYIWPDVAEIRKALV